MLSTDVGACGPLDWSSQYQLIIIIMSHCARQKRRYYRYCASYNVSNIDRVPHSNEYGWFKIVSILIEYPSCNGEINTSC